MESVPVAVKEESRFRRWKSNAKVSSKGKMQSHSMQSRNVGTSSLHREHRSKRVPEAGDHTVMLPQMKEYTCGFSKLAEVRKIFQLMMMMAGGERGEDRSLPKSESVAVSPQVGLFRHSH